MNSTERQAAGAAERNSARAELRAAIAAAVAAERERWTRRVEEAFYEGFASPETYNDTLQNSADEAWAKAKASLLRA